MKRQMILLLGVSQAFADVFNSPTRCSNSVSFRLNKDTYRAKGVATIEDQLYKFWQHDFVDVFTKTENLTKDLIISLHDASKFRSTLKYFGDNFDMAITADYSKEYDAYVAKKISISSAQLKIDHACMEVVFGYTEYSSELLEQKTAIKAETPTMSITSDELRRLIALSNIASFDKDDTTLNLESSDKKLRAYNGNFSQVLDSDFGTDFTRISIKSKFLDVLDSGQTWELKYDTLSNGGTKWVFTNQDHTIITVIGGLAHQADNDKVDVDAIDQEFKNEFEKYLS